jgi:hypothetical protein
VREAAWGNGSADKTDTAPQVDFTSPKSTNASTKPATSTHSPVPPDQPVPEIEPHPSRVGRRLPGAASRPRREPAARRSPALTTFELGQDRPGGGVDRLH